MKIIFRFLLLASLSLAFLSSNAQSIIVKGGLTLSTMSMKAGDKDLNENAKMKPGFHVGLAVDVPVAGSLSFEPGVLFNTKGTQAEVLGVKMKHNLNYIDIPLNMKYTLDVNSLSIWTSAGPYLGIGINGKNVIGDIETKIEFGDKKAYKMLDYGASVGVGANIGSIVVGAYYNIGLANISNIEIDNTSTKNNAILISLGYRIGS